MNNGALSPAIYKEILQYLSPRELPNPALTSREFQELARPLMFRDLSIGFTPSPRDLTRATRDKIAACLNFHTSQRIAPNVRTCSLLTSSWADTYSVAGPLWDELATRAEEIVGGIFRALYYFPNLRSLSISRTDGCRVKIVSRPPMVSAERLESILAGMAVYRYTDPTREFSAQAVALIPILCHSATSLVITWDDKMDDTFVTALIPMGPFQYLRKLTIFPHKGEQAPMFETLIGLCPALEELVILWDFDNIARLEDVVMLTFEPGAVPRLNCYQGPDEMINDLMEERPVRHLAVPSPNAQLASYCFVPSLEAIDERERIVSLDLRCHNLTAEFIGQVCGLFPNLRALAIWAREYDQEYNSEDMYAALATPGPHLQGLEFLTICLDNEYELLDVVDYEDPNAEPPQPRGKFIPFTFLDEATGYEFTPLPSARDETVNYNKDYTIGPDTACWDVNSPLFHMFDWGKVQLDQYARLQYLRVQSMNWPRRFVFEADRRRSQRGHFNIEEWREMFERQYRSQGGVPGQS
ncbi:hypothetical protein C8R47DRAFT_74306 [Mycena vitilis]|nr:hypothetical protein C8R47DRAFT_74306 [Mycena vitilis]